MKHLSIVSLLLLGTASAISLAQDSRAPEKVDHTTLGDSAPSQHNKALFKKPGTRELKTAPKTMSRPSRSLALVSRHTFYVRINA